MFEIESLQGVMVIVGPIVLGAILLWAVLNNRTSKRRKQETEEATRNMYNAQNAEDTRREP